MKTRLIATLCAAFAPFAASAAGTLTLDTFDAATTSGGVIAGSTWDGGNVSPNATFITVGGGAMDDNGWEYLGAPVDATGMNRLSLTAWQNPGNSPDALVVIQFEDINSNFCAFSFSTSDFLVGSAATRTLVLNWTGGFDNSQITGWTLGGGDPVGMQDYRMSFADLSLSVVAVPEPASYAAGAVFSLASVTMVRRRKKNPV